MKRSRFVQDFGKRVRELRLDAEMSQEDLASKAGLHRTAITHIERATRSSTLETIEKLSRALRVEPSDLLPTLRSRR